MRALGIPMSLEGTTTGALNVNDTQPRRWTDDEVDAAQLRADMATAHIVMVDQLRSVEVLADQLQQALDSRVGIEQAEGVLARMHDIGVSEAFERPPMAVCGPVTLTHMRRGGGAGR